MTTEADIIRDQRRAFARPGGAHDRLISFLGKALPAAIGVVAAVMILSPLSPRGEVGFLLDRNKVAVTGERLAVDRAMYRGQDGKGRPFSLTAGSAVQTSSEDPVIVLDNLAAQLQMSDGPARIHAPTGRYNYRLEKVTVDGPVNFQAADGYRMVTNTVDVDLKSQMATGSGGVRGVVPTGTFTADSIVADLDARTLILAGNARLRMMPGKLSLPK